MKRNLWGTLCQAAVLAIPLLGCAGPKRADIVGTWLPAGDAPRAITSVFLPEPILMTRQPSLVFQDDGTLAVQNMPEALLFGPGPERKAILSGKGTWSLGKYAGSQVVLLEFSSLGGKEVTSATQVQIGREARGMTLYFWMEEEGGKRFEFVKEARALPDR